MKHWAILILFFSVIIGYGMAHPNSLASKITNNIQKMSGEDVYASSQNVEEKINYVHYKPLTKQLSKPGEANPYQVFARVEGYIPVDCEQAIEMHKRQVSKADESLESFEAISNIRELKMYCVALLDPIALYIQSSRLP